MKFKRWLENLESQRDQELQRIWRDSFKALGIGGLSDEDAASQSLSKITLNRREPTTGQNATFNGKRAALKMLENGQIFQRIEAMQIPELTKAAEDTKAWLGQSDDNNVHANTNGSTTVAVLLQKLFGNHFETLVDKDFPKMDTAKAQVPPQPPKSDLGPNGPSPTGVEIEPQAIPQSAPTMPQPRPLGVTPGAF